jgi:hypothetical protein
MAEAYLLYVTECEVLTVMVFRFSLQTCTLTSYALRLTPCDLRHEYPLFHSFNRLYFSHLHPGRFAHRSNFGAVQPLQPPPHLRFTLYGPHFMPNASRIHAVTLTFELIMAFSFELILDAKTR